MRQQQTDRLRQQFVANVSHDFKTPLTLMISYAEERPPKRLRRPETDIGIPPSINTASAERSETKGMEKA